MPKVTGRRHHMQGFRSTRYYIDIIQLYCVQPSHTNQALSHFWEQAPFLLECQSMVWSACPLSRMLFPPITVYNWKLVPVQSYHHDIMASQAYQKKQSDVFQNLTTM